MLVTSLGLATAVHPNAKQGAIFHYKTLSAEFIRDTELSTADAR